MKKEITILAVCGCGMGSSQFLKMQMDDVLKKNGVKGVKTLCGDVMTCTATACDVIFTQPQLAEGIRAKVKVPVVTLTNYTKKQIVEESLMEYLKSLEE